MRKWTREELGKMTDDHVGEINYAITNQFAKWRSVFASWQLGTRSSDDAECKAVKDHREATMMMRAEINALTLCLIDAGVITARSFTEVLIGEIQHLDEAYEKKFPGIQSSPDGITYQLPEAAETMRGWPA